MPWLSCPLHMCNTRNVSSHLCRAPVTTLNSHIAGVRSSLPAVYISQSSEFVATAPILPFLGVETPFPSADVEKGRVIQSK